MQLKIIHDTNKAEIKPSILLRDIVIFNISSCTISNPINGIIKIEISDNENFFQEKKSIKIVFLTRTFIAVNLFLMELRFMP
jgi:hypothetical protein